jgi:hypothetical protein
MNTDLRAQPRPMSIESYAHARALSRQFFPTWSRRARARWVLAKLRSKAPKVPISTRWSPDLRAYWFNRTLRA